MYTLNHQEIKQAAALLGEEIREHKLTKCYPVPRGGVAAAYAVGQFAQFEIVDDPSEADFFIDDLIDSGATFDRYNESYPNVPFLVLFDKNVAEEPYNDWLVFPWEHSEEGSAEDIVLRQLQFIGEDVERGGLKETPKRVIKAWKKWFEGYKQKPEEVFKVFADGGENYDEMVVVKDIPFYSHCEHHIAPFFGTATIAYIPDGKIVGLSKLSRLVDVFARRLQVQERLTNQIVDAMIENLAPLGVGCVIKARHLCMESRGVSKQGHYTVTSSLHGVIRDQADTRAEFMRLAK